MNLIIFCPNLIGDTVMATPAFRSIRAGFPQATIHMVAKPFIAPVLEGLPSCNHTILHDPRSKNPEYQSTSVLTHLRNLNADLAILFPNSFRSAILAWRSGARKRLGYSRGGRGLLLTDRITPPNRTSQGFEPMPIVDYYMGLPQYLGCPETGRHLEQLTSSIDESAADRACQNLGLTNTNPLIIFNTGGAFGPAKNWPLHHFAQLATDLLKKIPKARIAIICGPAEAENAREIARLAHDNRVVSLADEPKSVGLSKAMIRRSQLVVTTDSGPRHFATAFQIPTVSLFGPTHMEWTRTQHPLAIHLQKRVDCGPCQQGTCPQKHHKCMTELDPQNVLAACLELLHFDPLLKGPHDRASGLYRINHRPTSQAYLPES